MVMRAGVGITLIAVFGYACFRLFSRVRESHILLVPSASVDAPAKTESKPP